MLKPCFIFFYKTILFTLFLLSVGKQADAQVDLGEIKKITLVPYIPVKINIKSDTLAKETEKNIAAYLKQKKYKVISEDEYEEIIKKFYADFIKKVTSLENMPSGEAILKMQLNSPTVVQTISVNYKNTRLITDKIYAGYFTWSVNHFPNGTGKEPRKTVDDNFLAENTLQKVIDKILNIITLK